MAYSLQHQTPAAGSLAWSNVHIVFDGVDYTIANGNTANKWVYWLKSSPTSLQSSNTYPTLGAEDALVFINRAGVGTSILDSAVTDGGLIVPGTITSEAISTGAISAGHIAAGAITASKIVVKGEGAALNTDPTCSDAGAWSSVAGNSNWQIATITDGKVGNTVLRSTGGAPSPRAFDANHQALDPNKTYRLHAWLRRKSGDRPVYLGVEFVNVNGARITGGTGWAGIGTFNYWVVASNTTILPADSVWREYTFTMGPSQFPSGAKQMRLGALLNDSGGSTDGVAEVQDFRIEEMISGSLIVDGSIDADHIAANAITAGKIAAGAVSATQIAANAITADRLAIGDFTNLAENQDFELGDAGWLKESNWTIVNDPANAYSGNWVAKHTSGNTTALRNNYKVTCIPGDTYYARAYLKSTVAGQGAFVRFSFINSAGSEISTPGGNTVTATSYTLSEKTSTAPANAAFVRVEVVAANNSSGIIYADEVAMFRVVDATMIKDGAITTAKIVAGAVTANEIAAGTITANEIAAGTITAGNISAGAIGTTELAASAVTASKIAAGTITANKLVISDFSNLAENPGFELGDVGSWNTFASGVSIANDSSNAAYGSYVLKRISTANDQVVVTRNVNIIDVKPGDTLYLAGQVKSTSDATGTAEWRLQWVNTSGSSVGTSTLSWTPSTAYSKKEGIYTAPSGAAQVYIDAVSRNQTAGTWYWDDCQVRKAVGNVLIENGAITASKIAAGTITANEIAANTITSGLIAAGAITADEIATNAVTTGKLTIGDISNNAENPSFEMGNVGWTPENAVWSIVNDSSNAYSGNYVARRTANATAYALRNNMTVRVTPGDQFYARAWLKSTTAGQGGYVRIRAINASGGETAVNGNSVTATSYAKSEVNYTVAAGIVAVSVDVYGTNTSGTLYADGVALLRRNTGELIVDGAIDGKVITGATIQTGTSGRRIQMDANDELRYYDADDIVVATIGISATNGADNAVAVFGTANGTSEVAGFIGVAGQSPDDLGVYGWSSTSYGIKGKCNTALLDMAGMAAIYGENIRTVSLGATTAECYGIKGVVWSSHAKGGGVYGSNDYGPGVVGYGLYGISAAVFSTTSGGHLHLIDPGTTAVPSWDAAPGTITYVNGNAYIKVAAGSGTGNWRKFQLVAA